MPRKATIERKTRETDIKLSLNLDGKGVYSIKTSIPFMDHMLSHVAKHGFFDLTVKARDSLMSVSLVFRSMIALRGM